MEEATNRTKALLQHLEAESIGEAEIMNIDDNNYKTEGGEYLVLTDEEADKKAKQEIERTLWAFNTDFLLSYQDGRKSLTSDLEDYEAEELREALEELQEKHCERANPIIKKMLKSFTTIEKFSKRATQTDGRGHFISHYDSNEYEEKVNGNYYFIYRLE